MYKLKYTVKNEYLYFISMISNNVKQKQQYFIRVKLCIESTSMHVCVRERMRIEDAK